MPLRLNCSNCNCQALLKIHCIDLADSRDPLAPSCNCSFTVSSISHNIAFGWILWIFRLLSQDLYMETVMIICKGPFRSIPPLLPGKNTSPSFTLKQ